MPAAEHIYNVDDQIISRLKRRAARHGRPVEVEYQKLLRKALAGEVEMGFDEMAALMRAITAGRDHTPAEVLVRESRDER